MARYRVTVNIRSLGDWNERSRERVDTIMFLNATGSAFGVELTSTNAIETTITTNAADHILCSDGISAVSTG
jgi:hypothetical protein